MNFHLTLESGNSKTGPIPVSTSDAATCPNACPLKRTDSVNGCYADGGPLGMHWGMVSSGQRGTGWDTFCKSIASLPVGQIWRHNQAGDLAGRGDTIDIAALDQLVTANKGRQGFTYTHKFVDGNSKLAQANRRAIKRANDRGFTINLSANTLAHADKLVQLNIGPVVVILPSDHVGNTLTPNGNHVIQCPATIKSSTVTCATCKLCAKRRDKWSNAPIIGFPAHGASKKRINKIIESSSQLS